jgi:hypothetical protein
VKLSAAMFVCGLAGLALVHGAEQSAPAQTPGTAYRETITFDDGSVELCDLHGVSIGFDTIDATASRCVGDPIFAAGFEP